MDERIQLVTTKQKALNLLQKCADALDEAEEKGDFGIIDDLADDIRTAISWLKENDR